VKDLTAHSIGKHILQMAAPIAAGMLCAVTGSALEAG
jgi:hypothetical protein